MIEIVATDEHDGLLVIMTSMRCTSRCVTNECSIRMCTRERLIIQTRMGHTQPKHSVVMSCDTYACHHVMCNHDPSKQCVIDRCWHGAIIHMTHDMIGHSICHITLPVSLSQHEHADIKGMIPMIVSLQRLRPKAEMTLATRSFFCSAVKSLGRRSMAAKYSVSHTVKDSYSRSSCNHVAGVSPMHGGIPCQVSTALACLK